MISRSSKEVRIVTRERSGDSWNLRGFREWGCFEGARADGSEQFPSTSVLLFRFADWERLREAYACHLLGWGRFRPGRIGRSSEEAAKLGSVVMANQLQESASDGVTSRDIGGEIFCCSQIAERRSLEVVTRIRRQEAVINPPGRTPVIGIEREKSSAVNGREVAKLVDTANTASQSRPKRHDRRGWNSKQTVFYGIPEVKYASHGVVHEAFIKLAAGQHTCYENRAHFYGIAFRLIRQVLVDTTRARAAESTIRPWKFL
jgi:hypothetical protein